jgi:uncharacterized protein (DUF1810 family)
MGQSHRLWLDSGGPLGHDEGMNEASELERFVLAQEPVMAEVLRELHEGRKRTHWMWFVFPQLAGLGRSPTAQAFAIASLDEARAYLEHPILGPRLRDCTKLATGADVSVGELFGSPDDVKFRSCMTLFAQATDDNRVFLDALTKFFGGVGDPQTLRLLGVQPAS